jgi:hypothetical protein
VLPLSLSLVGFRRIPVYGVPMLACRQPKLISTLGPATSCSPTAYWVIVFLPTCGSRILTVGIAFNTSGSYQLARHSSTGSTARLFPLATPFLDPQYSCPSRWVPSVLNQNSLGTRHHVSSALSSPAWQDGKYRHMTKALRAGVLRTAH